MPPSKRIWIGLLLRAAPIAFLFWFYKDALRTWFQQDDFAWLLLRQNLHTAGDWIWGMFTPFAQGTVRPISERLFFVWGREFYFLDPRPMHIVVALTQSASVLILFSLVVRLIDSRLAACLACFAWLASAGMATPMSWLSTYNQILISLVFLGGLRAYIAAVDTGRRRWLVICWCTFLLGFGVLEINVVFPALLTAWIVLYRRELWRKSQPFWVVSIAYAIAHSLWASKPATGVYARHWDLSMFHTYLRYWGTALAGGSISYEWKWPPQSWIWAAWGIAGLIALILVLRRRDPEARCGLLGVIWFSAVLGPILPLRDHFSEYYLASAAPGLAVAIAGFAVLAWRSGAYGRMALAVVVVAHIGLNAPANLEVTRWRYARGERIQVLVEGLERAVQLHPGDVLFVSGLDRDLFWSAFSDKPFALFGTEQVYLFPGDEKSISDEPELGSMAQYIAPKVLVVRSLKQGRGFVYRFEEKALRNVTKRILTALPADWQTARPTFVDVGMPEWSGELLEGWHPAEENRMRWMKQRASLILGVPADRKESFFLGGYCPREQLSKPVTLQVWLGETRLGEVVVSERNWSFEAELPVPAEAAKKAEVIVRIEANRTISMPGDARELSVAFGRIGFR